MDQKRFLFFLLGVLPMLVSAQGLAKKGRSVEDIVPQDSSFIKAEGDLNKDGRSDLVVYAQPVLAIYFATPSGDYELWKQYNDVLPFDEESDVFYIEIDLSVTDRGALKIDVGSFASAGTSYNSQNNYTFRFQNGDFFKIGEEKHSMSRMTGNAETVSTNYLTHKRQVVKENVFDETIIPKENWTTIPKKPLKRLGEEVLNY